MPWMYINTSTKTNEWRRKKTKSTKRMSHQPYDESIKKEEFIFFPRRRFFDVISYQ